MAKEFFKNLPDTSTPLNASRLNGLLNGNEAMGNIVVGDVKCKNLFNINGSYTIAVNSPTINGNNISVPNSEGNSGWTKFNQKIEVKGSLILSCVISGGGGYARPLLIPLDSSGNVVTDLTIDGYTYLSAYTGYYGQCQDGNYELVLSFPERVKYFQLGFIHLQATFSNIQLEEGTNVTEYTPYKAFGIESGSNSNGSWVKFEDGTMICRHKIVGNTFNCNRRKSDNHFYYDDESGTETNNLCYWTYPQKFINTEDLTVNLTVGSNAYTMPSIDDGITTTQAVGYCVTPYAVNNITFIWNFTAIGRWK